MVLVPLSGPLVATALVLVGLGLAAWAAHALGARRRARRSGVLVAVDPMDRRGTPMRSVRYGIVGRPDELRRLRDGRIVPVEVKSRSTPPGGPPRSHRVQVAAYALLVEETTGVPPPYGLLRYSDGGEFRIPWDRAARSELLAIRTAVDLSYDGGGLPTPAKCRRCPWRDACDLRADRPVG